MLRTRRQAAACPGLTTSRLVHAAAGAPRAAGNPRADVPSGPLRSAHERHRPHHHRNRASDQLAGCRRLTFPFHRRPETARRWFRGVQALLPRCRPGGPVVRCLPASLPRRPRHANGADRPHVRRVLRRARSSPRHRLDPAAAERRPGAVHHLGHAPPHPVSAGLGLIRSADDWSTCSAVCGPQTWKRSATTPT